MYDNLKGRVETSGRWQQSSTRTIESTTIDNRRCDYWVGDIIQLKLNIDNEQLVRANIDQKY